MEMLGIRTDPIEMRDSALDWRDSVGFLGVLAPRGRIPLLIGATGAICPPSDLRRPGVSRTVHADLTSYPTEIVELRPGTPVGAPFYNFMKNWKYT